MYLGKNNFYDERLVLLNALLALLLKVFGTMAKPFTSLLLLDVQILSIVFATIKKGNNSLINLASKSQFPGLAANLISYILSL
jgi:hypothetical protein